MSQKKISSGIILTFLLVFTGLYLTQSFLYNYNQPTYYSQYNLRPNYGYYYNSLHQPYYGYNNRLYPSGPYPVLSTSCNSIYGCKTSYSSYMHVDSALDYAYYTNPWLLEPRYMDNHQRYARGLWPQGLYY